MDVIVKLLVGGVVLGVGFLFGWIIGSFVIMLARDDMFDVWDDEDW